MNTYEIYQKYASISLYRANKPLPEQPILGYYQAANLYEAIKAAAQEWKAPALLLSGARVATGQPSVV
jgi:hypothetical protein